MKFEIKVYTNEFGQVWDEFVANSINGTFLHTRAFYNHNPKNASEDCSFLFFKKNKLVALLPCSLYTRDNSKILHSHLRSTYGGFVINDEIGAEGAVEIVGLLIEQAKKMEIGEIIIRNPFRIFHKALCDETDYAMWYYGFGIKSRELETAIALGDYNEVKDRYDGSTSRSVKKAVDHVHVKMSDEYEAYWAILERNLAIKHGLKPTHSFSEFKNLLAEVGGEKIKLFGAFKDGIMIAGIVVFIVNRSALHAQYIASDDAYQEHRPLNAVIDEIVKWGCSAGFKFFNLGTSNADSGRSINTGLFRFKEGFGGRNTLRETMYLIL